MFRTVALPGALPLIMTGIKLGAGMGLVLIAIAEMIGAKQGLGYMIWNAWELFDVETMYVGLFVIAIIGFVMNAGFDAIEHCAAIGAAADRLICYDKVAGRAPAPTEPVAEQSATGAAAVPTTSRLVPKDAPLANSASPRPDTGNLSRYWELEPSDKRGIFNFVGYQPNYVLPLHYSTRINRSPQSPTQAAVSKPDYHHEEAKFQFSLRTKVVQDVPLIGGDVWVAFTQQALCQVDTRADSKPFRNIDYQPEAIYVLPTAPGLRDLPF
eukprot:gene26412-34572_t